SRLLAEIDRKRSCSNSGWEAVEASSSTRWLNSSHDSSRLVKRCGSALISTTGSVNTCSGSVIFALARLATDSLSTPAHSSRLSVTGARQKRTHEDGAGVAYRQGAVSTDMPLESKSHLFDFDTSL